MSDTPIRHVPTWRNPKTAFRLFNQKVHFLTFDSVKGVLLSRSTGVGETAEMLCHRRFSRLWFGCLPIPSGLVLCELQTTGKSRLTGRNGIKCATCPDRTGDC